MASAAHVVYVSYDARIVPWFGWFRQGFVTVNVQFTQLAFQEPNIGSSDGNLSSHMKIVTACVRIGILIFTFTAS